jgi:uncharacterized protein (TIGR02996 family)
VTEAEWIAFLQRPEIPAFNRAMLDKPDDNLPRLVFADWMDENCPDTAVNTAVRESITTRDPHGQWVDVQPLGGLVGFIRGRHHVSIQDEVRPMSVAWPTTLLSALWQANWIGQIFFNVISEESLSVWVNDQGMGAVESLTLIALHSAKQLVNLLASPQLTALTSLGVQSSHEGPAMLEAILDSAVLPRLVALELDGMGFRRHVLQRMFRAPQVQGLKSLTLRRCFPSVETLVTLANCPHLRGLERLSFSTDQVDRSGTAALANSPYLCEAIRAQWRR